MISTVYALLLFAASCVRASVTHESSTTAKADSLRALSDDIVGKVHDQMREVLEMRRQKFPDARDLLDVDMKQEYVLEQGDNNTIFGFGWREGKFVRCYSPKHYDYSKAFNNITDVETDRRKFYNRYKERKANPKQMQCMLYAKISAVQYNAFLRMSQFTVQFRSPCKTAIIVRQFIVSDSVNMPVVVELNFGANKYMFEFDDKPSYNGYGNTRVTLYQRYKLLNYYVATVNWLIPPRLPDPAIMLAQYESSGQSANFDTSSAQPRSLLITTSNGPEKNAAENEENIKLNFKGAKAARKYRKLYYRANSLSWLPYKDIGTDEIIKSEDPKKPFFTSDIIDSVWNGNNPTQCTISAITPKESMEWSNKFSNMYTPQQMPQELNNYFYPGQSNNMSQNSNNPQFNNGNVQPNNVQQQNNSNSQYNNNQQNNNQQYNSQQQSNSQQFNNNQQYNNNQQFNNQQNNNNQQFNNGNQQYGPNNNQQFNNSNQQYGGNNQPYGNNQQYNNNGSQQFNNGSQQYGNNQQYNNQQYGNNQQNNRYGQPNYAQNYYYQTFYKISCVV